MTYWISGNNWCNTSPNWNHYMGGDCSPTTWKWLECLQAYPYPYQMVEREHFDTLSAPCEETTPIHWFFGGKGLGI